LPVLIVAVVWKTSSRFWAWAAEAKAGSRAAERSINTKRFVMGASKSRVE